MAAENEWAQPFKPGDTVYVRNRSGRVQSRGVVTSTEFAWVEVKAEEDFYSGTYWWHKSRGTHSSNFMTTFITHSDKEFVPSPHGP